LSEDVDGDGWVTKLRERAFQDNGPDEQNACGPNVEVDVRGTVCVDQQNASVSDRRRWRAVCRTL